MLSRKNIFIKLLFSLLILFGAQVHAHSGDWVARVNYSDRTSTLITAATSFQCNFRLESATNYPPSGKEVVGSTPCMRVPHIHRGTIPDLSYPELNPPIRWPIPRPCLSCPYDFQDYLQRINPAQSEKVKDLMYDFNIDAYNEDVINLQEQYNINEFMNELNIIENINRDDIKNNILK